MADKLPVKFKMVFSSEVDNKLRAWCTKHYECTFDAVKLAIMQIKSDSDTSRSQ